MNSDWLWVWIGTLLVSVSEDLMTVHELSQGTRTVVIPEESEALTYFSFFKFLLVSEWSTFHFLNMLDHSEFMLLFFGVGYHTFTKVLYLAYIFGFTSLLLRAV